MPCNVVRASACQTKAGDVIVVWGDKRQQIELWGQVFEVFGGDMIISVLREGKNKWYRKDFYIGIIAGGMDIKELADGRILVSYYQGAVVEPDYQQSSMTSFIFVSKGWDGWERRASGGRPFINNAMTNIVYDKRNGRIYCSQTGVYWYEVEHTGKELEMKERKRAVIYPGMCMDEAGRVMGVRNDGEIMAGTVDLQWEANDDFYQTKMKYVEGTMTIKHDRAGNMWICGYSIGARKGEEGFGGFGVERENGGYTEQGIEGWWKTRTAFEILFDGRVFIGVPDKDGANIWKAETGTWYADGIYFYISNDGGKTFSTMPVKNEGIKMEW